MPTPIPRLLMGIAAVCVLALALHAPGSSAHPRRGLVQRPGVLIAGEHRLGALPASETLRGTVVMRPRDPQALTRFIATVTDPGSPREGEYLGPGRFAARFGPTAGARRAVVSALRAGGLHVGAISSDGLLLGFSGSAANVRRTFGTTIDAVRLADGSLGRVTGSAVSLPSPAAAAVETVVGLDDTSEPHYVGAPPHATRRHARGRAVAAGRAAAAPPATGSGTGPVACPEASAAATQDNGLTDPQIADAYGAAPLYASGDDGAGQRIAVYELEPFERSDLAQFDTCYFGAARAATMLGRLHIHEIAGGQPSGPGEGEASLDVEDVSALAPGAGIDVYTAPQSDALGAYAAIVDADRDRIVTTSWGECEQAVQRGERGVQQAENLLFQQAAAQGQTVFAAAGDSGSDDCASGSAPSGHENPVSVDDPASQPYVVGVGGTAIDDPGSGSPLEHVWNDGPAYGAGGGGISMSWTMPAWQRAARLPGIALPGDRTYRRADALEQSTGHAPGFCDGEVAAATGAAPCRLVPDVAAQADEFTGGVTVYSASYESAHFPTGWTTAGGTSSAAPTWAAMLALVDASPACADDARTRRGVGFAAPLLYAVASNPATYAASFTDVRTGDNDLYGLDNGHVYAAGPGYDLASGLGSPLLTGVGGAPGLATDLCEAAASAAAPSVRTLLPALGPARGGGRLVIRGAGFAARGRSQVVSVQVGTRRIPAAELHVRGPHTIALTLPGATAAVPPATSDAEHGYGAVAVIVSLRDGESSSPGPRAMFRYEREAGGSSGPTVGMVAPYGGPERHGAGVTILGSGFRHVTAVTFGGVRAAHFRIRSAQRITVTPPARIARTRCTPLPRHGIYSGENARNDVCQVQVRVHEGGHLSPQATIRAPLEGPQLKDAFGDVLAFRGCQCETAPAADEYDYLPRPHVTSVSTHSGPASLANEHGGTLIVVHGSGLNPLDLDWADFGDPRLFASERTDYVYATATELELRAPAHPITPAPLGVAFSVRSLGGQSNARPVEYAGVPAVSAVVNPRNPRNLHGLYGGPATGRTPIVIHGAGLSGEVIGLQFIGQGHQAFSLGSQYLVAAGPAGTLRADTVAENPAVVAVEPCTVTGCSKPGAPDLFWLYGQGTPQVSAVSPDSGPAAGGTVATISGANLGCPLSVQFGSTPASTVTTVKTLLACGSSSSLTATAPPGVAGSVVPVTVQTAESFYTGSAPVSAATFSYH